MEHVLVWENTKTEESRLRGAEEFKESYNFREAENTALKLIDEKGSEGDVIHIAHRGEIIESFLYKPDFRVIPKSE